MQSDPIGLLGGVNSFVYGSVNPLTRIDPFGLDVMTVQEEADFLNAMDVMSVSDASLGESSIPPRSRELRERERAMVLKLPFTAARQAALQGSAEACTILTYEAAGIAAGYVVGTGLYAAGMQAKAALATATGLERINSAASLISAANIFAGTASTSEAIATLGILHAERQIILMEMAKLSSTTIIATEMIID